MAQSNKRFFNTYFYEDPYIEGLDSKERILYLTMILNPHNNLAGCYEISIQKLKNYTALEENDIRAGIQKLQEDRKILFTGTWLSLKNFIKNNELNPNMCKNAFDIMKAAPKENILFIVADSAGNAEPWLEEFVNKIEKGINASIDSKNRNLIAKSKQKNEPIPLLEDHIIFSMNEFIETILNPTKKLLEGKGSPNHSTTIPKALREPSGEKEGERELESEWEGEKEYELEYELEKEKEIEKGNDSPFKQYVPNEEKCNSIESKIMDGGSLMDSIEQLSKSKKM